MSPERLWHERKTKLWRWEHSNIVSRVYCFVSGDEDWWCHLHSQIIHTSGLGFSGVILGVTCCYLSQTRLCWEQRVMSQVGAFWKGFLCLCPLLTLRSQVWNVSVVLPPIIRLCALCEAYLYLQNLSNTFVTTEEIKNTNSESESSVGPMFYLQTGKVMAWLFFPLKSFFSTRAFTTNCLASKRFTPLKRHKPNWHFLKGTVQCWYMRMNHIFFYSLYNI